MTRQPHDNLAKECLAEYLNNYGQVEINKPVQNESQEIDVFFTPFATKPDNLPDLGLINLMINKAGLFEPYRNPITPVQIRSCLTKIGTMEAKIINQFEREKRTYTESDCPELWILTPTCSEKILNSVGAILINPEISGFYYCPSTYKLNLIVIHQLPINQDTLWLRILGRGGIQQRAIDELIELTPENPYRKNLLQFLGNWRKSLELRANLTQEQQEDVMNLSPAYIQQCQEWIQEGEQRGEQKGKKEMIENFFRVRFGVINQDLESIIPQLLQLPGEELSRILLNASESELLHYFDQK